LKIHDVRWIRAWVSVDVIQGGFLVVLVSGIHVDFRETIGKRWFWGLIIPFPEGECECVVVQKLCEDPLVKVEEETVPWKEYPAVMYLESAIGFREEESCVAIRAVYLRLILP
jgi:hypothetical protein